MITYLLKSIHFKKTVVQSSFLSKVFVLISAKMTTLLKEMRIAQLSSWNERTFSSNRIFSFNFKLLFQWKDTENGRQLMKHMKVMEDFNKQSNRLAGGDPMGKYFWLFFSKFGAFFYGFNLFFYIMVQVLSMNMPGLFWNLIRI